MNTTTNAPVDTAGVSDRLERLFVHADTTIARDLKLNLTRLLEQGALARDEALLALLASARAVEDQDLELLAREALAAFDLSREQVEEAAQSAAIMAMLNIYYRFRHMIANDDDYRTTGLRMTSLAKPILGKESFEMLAFAVSVINGCESCIKAHEKALRDAGVGVEKIHDLARMAAVVRGIKTLRSNPSA
jgi:alkyl hydroperoxide reductase subunit D